MIYKKIKAWFHYRSARKGAKLLLRDAKHVRLTREDIADQTQIEGLLKSEQKMLRAIKDRTALEDLEQLSRELSQWVSQVSPPKSSPKIRENVEVFVIAIAAAMAIRAYFLQPFKIPTGSMQPTLNGIKAEVQSEPTVWDKFLPLKFTKWFFTGDSYKQIRAETSGRLMPGGYRVGNDIVLSINDRPHKIPQSMAKTEFLSQKEYFNRGDILAQAQLSAGDHILVNKISYNFSRPKRGNIVVFDTQGLPLDKECYYIKRLVGLPDERVQIKNGQLVVNGSIIDSPEIFKRIQNTELGYNGYSNRALLASSADFIQIGSEQFLPFGDNTDNSKDGRYFGPVELEKILGPAFFVYWPFTDHWGLIN